MDRGRFQGVNLWRPAHHKAETWQRVGRAAFMVCDLCSLCCCMLKILVFQPGSPHFHFSLGPENSLSIPRGTGLVEHTEFRLWLGLADHSLDFDMNLAPETTSSEKAR